MGIHTDKDPCYESMGVVSIQIAGDIGHAEHVQLLHTSATSDVDGEQNGPGDETSDKADGRGNF